MITASTSSRAKPSSASSWCSQTAYWSAVRRGSVAIRQRARITPSSTSAKTTLVFPASIASSMAASDQEDVAGVNDTDGGVRQAQPEGAGLVEAGEQAFAFRGGKRR